MERHLFNVEIYGRRGIEKRSQQPFPAKTALISICDHYRMPPTLKYKPGWRLSLVFDDIRLPEAYSHTLLYGFGCTAEDATWIASFLYGPARRAELIICQCEAGVSRSAAVAAAIREHFFGDGAVVLNDPMYDPNPHVYHMVLDALKRRQREQS